MNGFNRQYTRKQFDSLDNAYFICNPHLFKENWKDVPRIYQGDNGGHTWIRGGGYRK